MRPVPPVTRITDASSNSFDVTFTRGRGEPAVGSRFCRRCVHGHAWLRQSGPDVYLGSERQMDRAAIGNRQQPPTLFLVEDAFELDISFNEREPGSARFASGTIFSVDARMTEANCDTLQCPLLTPCVHRDSHGRARAKSSKQKVVRRWAAVCSAHRCRFVAHELMRAGDDLLGKTGRCTSYDDNAFPLLAMHKPLVLSAPPSRAAAYPNASDALRASASTIITHRRVMRGPQNDSHGTAWRGSVECAVSSRGMLEIQLSMHCTEGELFCLSIS
jgi:hypothetical protein